MHPRRAGVPAARQPAAAGLPEPRAEAGGRPRGAVGRRSVNIVVLQADDRQFGLVVDEINDTEEIVVKPLRQAAEGHRRASPAPPSWATAGSR